MAKFLKEEELRVLIDYINNSLDHKMDKGSLELPDNIVSLDQLIAYAASKEELNDYAKKSEVINSLPENLVYSDDLNAYAPLSELNNYATADELQNVKNQLNGIYHFKGSVADLAALQAIENPVEGDVYNLEDTGMNAAWTGSAWDEFGTIVDLSGYAKEEDIQSISRNELNALLYGRKNAVVADVEGIKAMLDNDEPEVVMTLGANLNTNSALTIPSGKKVTLDLNGNTLSATAGTIPVYANGGEVTIKNGTVSATSDAVSVRNGGLLTIDNANITSTGRNAISATESEVVINSGSITSQEAGVLGLKDSIITINGGTLEGLDNCPVMGNGSAAGSANDGTNMNVVMNGGKLIAKIQSAGYIACGVYVPNSGSFTMNGGEIISDGAGLVMRGGKVTLNGGKITANGAAGATGKVGDSRVVVGSYAVVYDANSKYPAMNSLELVIGKDMILEGTDGDIQTILADGVEANITDNR
jgi:hypothetical protein